MRKKGRMKKRRRVRGRSAASVGRTCNGVASVTRRRTQSPLQLPAAIETVGRHSLLQMNMPKADSLPSTSPRRPPTRPDVLDGAPKFAEKAKADKMHAGCAGASRSGQTNHANLTQSHRSLLLITRPTRPDCVLSTLESTVGSPCSTPWAPLRRRRDGWSLPISAMHECHA
jgi:hypothetical protein